jgi:hypothetical protein
MQEMPTRNSEGGIEVKSAKLFLAGLMLVALAGCITIEPTPKAVSQSPSNSQTSSGGFRNHADVRDEMCDTGYCFRWDTETDSYIYSSVSDGYMLFQDELGDFGYLLDWTLLNPERAANAVFEWQWVNGVRGADMDWVEASEQKVLNNLQNTNRTQNDDSCRGDLCCMIDADTEGIMVTLCYWE